MFYAETTIPRLLAVLMFVTASATENTRDFCGLFPLHIAKYAANRGNYSTEPGLPLCAAPL